MNNASWKHHYLPVFYLKGFTKDSGKFKIYNVEKNNFVQNGKEFSPKAFFFEKNSNTIFSDNGDTEFIENSYSTLENKIAKIIQKIDSSDSTTRFNICEDDMPLLNIFTSLIYWRLPQNRSYLETIMAISTPQELGFEVISNDGTVDHFESERVKFNPDFFKSYRFLTALFDTIRGIDCRTPYTILPRYDGLPYLCSDNPIIFEKDEFPNVHMDNYIIPLSGKRFFIKANKAHAADHNLFLLIDIIIYKQAVKYVSCTHKEYINILEENFKKYNMTLSQLKKELFRLIN